jgi:hypothetical protein
MYSISHRPDGVHGEALQMVTVVADHLIDKTILSSPLQFFETNRS